MSGQLYASRGMLNRVPFVSGDSARRVTEGEALPRAHIPHPEISSHRVTIDRDGRLAIYLVLGVLAALDGVIFALIGLR